MGLELSGVSHQTKLVTRCFSQNIFIVRRIEHDSEQVVPIFRKSGRERIGLGRNLEQNGALST